MNEMNEKISYKMGLKFAVPLYMSRIFEIIFQKSYLIEYNILYCMKL